MFGGLFAAIGPNSALSQLIPPTSKFDPKRDMPASIEKKIMLVTGGNSGLGLETCRRLVERNVGKLYLAARSKAKADAAIAELRKEFPQTKTEIIFHQLDLGDLKAIRASADALLAKESKLDVLFNNAGIMKPKPGDLTAQGYDIQWGTNVLGPYFFTECIKPALQAPSNEPSRIVNTSSFLHTATVPTSSGIDEDTFAGGAKRDEAIKKMGGKAMDMLYGMSKLGNIFVSDTWAAEAPQSIISCALHPGLIKTNIVSHTDGGLPFPLSMAAADVELGALTQLYGGTMESASTINGAYLIPWARHGSVSTQATDPKTRAQVLAWLKKACEGY